jgi:hypothetical protein
LKRLIMLAALSLAAVPLFVLSASAAGPAPLTASDVVSASTRATPESLSATTTPRRDRTRPYTFTTTGTLVPPTTFCAPGAHATSPSGPGNCIQIFCPPGVLNPAYCVRPPQSLICSGTVTVRFKKGDTTISSRTVLLNPDCTYRSRVSFRTRSRSRKGTFRVRARFEGNVLLNPINSPTHTVRAG